MKETQSGTNRQTHKRAQIDKHADRHKGRHVHMHAETNRQTYANIHRQTQTRQTQPDRDRHTFDILHTQMQAHTHRRIQTGADERRQIHTYRQAETGRYRDIHRQTSTQREDADRQAHAERHPTHIDEH